MMISEDNMQINFKMIEQIVIYLKEDFSYYVIQRKMLIYTFIICQFSMLLKAFAVSLVIFSIYFLGLILQKLIRGSRDLNTNSYHIGCYDSEINLNESKRIQQYFFTLSTELAPYSNAQAKKYKEKTDSRKVRTDAANTLALTFKQYISAYQNIRNLNQYEESYNMGLREARNNYLACRNEFLKEDWDCKGSYSQYLQSDEEFTLIKSNLSVLIQQKFIEQQKIQQLLATDQRGNQQDYEKYRGKIQTLNKQLAHHQQLVKQKNESLLLYQNKEFKLIYDLNINMKQIQECQRSKKEIQTCKTIIQRLKQVFTGIDLTEIQHRVQAKRKIIQKYNSALVKSNKLGQDTTEIKSQLMKNTQQLNKLLEIYSDTQVLSMCSGDFIKKCSDEHSLNLQKNISSMQHQLQNLRALKSQIQLEIQNKQILIIQLRQSKDKVAEDYQNSLGLVDKMKEIQVFNEKRLSQYKQKINKINQEMAGLQKNIISADEKRKKAIEALDVIIRKAGNLVQCLSKKEYLLKLQNKRPKNREQDKNLKRLAAQALIKLLRITQK